MVQHRLGDFEAHAEALQLCRERPAQVMQPPAGNTGCGVERRLRFRPAAHGRCMLAREDECQLRALVRAGEAETGAWAAWRISSMSPEFAPIASYELAGYRKDRARNLLTS